MNASIQMLSTVGPYLFTFMLLVPWIFFFRGLRTVVLARRRVQDGLQKEPFHLTFVAKRMMWEALREERDATSIPKAMLKDAVRRNVEASFYEEYLKPVSMNANILPPLGFLGTLSGMVGVFLSESQADLSQGSLALALLTTLEALFLYSILEIFLLWFPERSRRAVDRGIQEGLKAFDQEHQLRLQRLQRQQAAGKVAGTDAGQNQQSSGGPPLPTAGPARSASPMQGSTVAPQNPQEPFVPQAQETPQPRLDQPSADQSRLPPLPDTEPRTAHG